MRPMRAAQAPRRLSRETTAQLARIELMVFDVDGVMTDGKLYFGANGEALKAFHVLDGAGIKALAAAGVVTGVISGRESPMTLRRCAELGIRHVAQGIADKTSAFDALRHELGKTAEVCGYMGDDEIDVAVMRRVGFAATVPNAADGVAAFAHWVSRREGGAGAVREVCDLLIRARRDAAGAVSRVSTRGGSTRA
jgi:3-deoxy-D-manno-octulosonate 8-phosphate phosphatase (KDO 8-P phosphatase)